MIAVDTSNVKTLCEQYSLKSFALFGSVTSDSFNDASDVDVLISFDSTLQDNYFDTFFSLKEELESYWNRSVDLVVEKKFRNQYFRESVEQSKVVLYEQ